MNVVFTIFGVGFVILVLWIWIVMRTGFPDAEPPGDPTSTDPTTQVDRFR